GAAARRWGSGRRGHRGPAELPGPARADGRDRPARPCGGRALRERDRTRVARPPGPPPRLRRGHRRRGGAAGPPPPPLPLGLPPQYGGPYLGILASTDALVRQIPGRLVGMTTDVRGQRAFVMTLRAREQDIRRDKAASNICTNQALLALAASIYLAAIGPHGLRDVAAQGAARAAHLEAALAAVGAPRIHRGPYLNEFAVRVPDAKAVHRRLIERGILAGLALADVLPDEPSLADALLVCATEVTTDDEIGRFAAALAAELGAYDHGATAAGDGVAVEV